MSKLFRAPKVMVAVIVLAGLLIVGLAGGALGNEFGGGFIGAPMPHLQLPAEPVLSNDFVLGWKLTNTMLAGWLTIVILTVLAFFATRRMSDVPRGLQNVFEVLIEYFLNLAENIAGREKARRFFPLVMTIFIFIVAANWIGILPGFGSVGRIESPKEIIHHLEEDVDEGVVADLAGASVHVFDGEGSFAIMPFGSVNDVITLEQWEHDGVADGKQAGRLAPFFRSANTDINMTLAIALVAMVTIHFWAFRTLGLFAHSGKFINFKQGPVWLFVGILEGISEIARIISFTFRLFGNIFAGEVLLFAMAFLVPLIGIMPFLGLELFVGLIQGFIFSMLTLVFAASATLGHSEDH